MTREERAIQILEQRVCCRECVVENCTCAECDEAFDMAIKALEQEPCDDVVSRQAVLARREILRDEQGTGYQAVKTKYIRELPPVRPQEQTGHWIKKDGYSDCSECGSHIVTEWDYCPNCGAKMESEDKE